MILAEKIILLRKKNGWSQEELADQLHVSRQAVSKWESAQSVPDLNKIILMSQVFDVSTDSLLKDSLTVTDERDEIHAIEKATIAPVETRKVTMEEANQFIEIKEKASKWVALGTAMCILSPCIMFILIGLSYEPFLIVREDIAAMVGLSIMFVLVAVAVVMFISVGTMGADFEFLEKEVIETEYGVRSVVLERKKNFRNTYMTSNTIGVALCILSAIPLFLCGLLADNHKEGIIMFMLCITVCMVAIAVFMFVRVGVKEASMEKILQEGDYSVEKKKGDQVSEKIGAIYWPIVVAGYLGYSFITMDWGRSWIVWPVAGVLFAAIVEIAKSIYSKGK